MRAPDHFDAPDEPRRCAACSAPIEDETSAKENYKGQLFCADCLGEHETRPPMKSKLARALFTVLVGGKA